MSEHMCALVKKTRYKRNTLDEEMQAKKNRGPFPAQIDFGPLVGGEFSLNLLFFQQ
jgi:hypothetical protein